MDLISKFSGDESGASSVEYAILLMCIAVAAAAAVKTFGTGVLGLFELANDKYPK